MSSHRRRCGGYGTFDPAPPAACQRTGAPDAGCSGPALADPAP
ncbi:hypothetical protein [Algimonas arctica]|nr:hypothetical protein [Algimonas arctica]